MSSDRRLLSTLTREVPPDLAVLVVVVAATWLTLSVELLANTPLVVPLALLFVLVAPGYAVVSALFPARRTAETDDGHRLDVRGLDFPERLALGVGTSIVVAPFVAFALQATVVGVARTPVVLLLGVFTLVATAVAIVRWRALPPAFRYRVPISLPRTGPVTDRLLVVVVAVVVVVAISSVSYAATTSSGGEDLTEFYVLAVQDDGTLLADNYPSTVFLGETTRLYVGLDNHRDTATTYTVVGVVQQVDLDSGEVLRQEEFQRYTTTVADGESWGVRHDFTPVWTGVNIRVAYLLYIDSQPTAVSLETADNSVHLWMDVVDPLSTDAPGTRPPTLGGGQPSAPVDGSNEPAETNGTNGTNETAETTNGTNETAETTNETVETNETATEPAAA